MKRQIHSTQVLGATALLFLQFILGCSGLESSQKSISVSSLASSSNPLGNLTKSKFQSVTSNEAMSIDANNVYSPNLIIQGGTLVMYFGGWDNPGQTHDNIYRSECPTLGTCQGAALLLDSVALGFEHLNDPSVLLLPNGTYLMYMTGVYAGQGGLGLAGNHIFVAESSDAIHWSQPSEIVHDMWLPSATLGPDNHVYLYGNCTTCTDAMVRYDVGTDGLSPAGRAVVPVPRFYSNVEVRYISQIGSYQIVGETNVGGQDQIDFLQSSDGLNWNLTGDGIIKPHAGQAHVGTPAFFPNNGYFVYYRETSDPGNTQNKIWGMQWSVVPGSDNIPAPASQTDYAATVNGMYQTYLSRDADPGGMASWSSQLQSGAITVAQLPHFFATCEEAGLQMKQMAIDILGRDPAQISAQDAINWWSSYLESNSMAQTRAMFLASPEGQQHAQAVALSGTDVIGYVDGVQRAQDGHYFISGWACDRNTADQVRVDFYIGGPAGSGRGVNSAYANLPAEPAVAAACRDASGAAHRYQIPIPADIMNGYTGQGIYVHGISQRGLANNLLNQSRMITIPDL